MFTPDEKLKIIVIALSSIILLHIIALPWVMSRMWYKKDEAKRIKSILFAKEGCMTPKGKLLRCDSCSNLLCNKNRDFSFNPKNKYYKYL